MSPFVLIRLQMSIGAVCPIVGLSGAQGAVRIDYAPSATQAQRDAAQAALAAFDWSQAAHDAWLTAQARTTAKAWVLGPSMEARAVKALALLLLQEVNALRTRANMVPPSYTEQQLLDAFLAKIDVA